MKPEPLSRSILVVDDNPTLLRAIGSILEILGHRVTSCLSLEEALAALPREKYDVVISDLRLGDDDGKDVIRAARAAHPDARIVAMSGADIPLGQSFMSSLGAEYGNVVPLVKPFNHDDLMTALGLGAAAGDKTKTG